MANKQNEQRIYDALNLQCKQLGSLRYLADGWFDQWRW